MTDYQIMADLLLQATKHAYQKATHGKSMEKLRDAIRHADSYAKRLHVLEGEEKARAFREDFQRHADRVIGVLRDRGTEFKKSEFASIEGKYAEELAEDLKKFAAYQPGPRMQILAKTGELMRALRKGKVIDFKTRQVVDQSPTQLSEPRGFGSHRNEEAVHPAPHNPGINTDLSHEETVKAGHERIRERFGPHPGKIVPFMYKLHNHDEPYAGGDVGNVTWRTKEKDKGMWNDPMPVPAVAKKHGGTIGKRVAQGGPDPLPWMDIKYRSTHSLLREHKDQPLNIHTRSDLIAHDDYMVHLTPGKHKIYMHIPTSNTKYSFDSDPAGHFTRATEPGVPSVKRRLEAVQRLKDAGHDVTLVHDKFEHPDLHPTIKKLNTVNEVELARAGVTGVPVETNHVKLTEKGLKRTHKAMGLEKPTVKLARK